MAKTAAAAPALVKLDFKEALIQTGKRETTDALLKRIKLLHQKLASLEQDLTDVRSLDQVKKPLINQTILHHKDRGVKAYAACCLADLLRVYAPDAPYNHNQLRDIFQFILTQILLNFKPSTTQARPLQPSKNKSNEATQQSQSQSQLSQRITDIPYYAEYYHLIENLATIKSVVLICDVPGAEELIEGFFTGFMDIIRPDMSKTVIRYLRDILVALAEESATLPAGVMDCIISQFETYASKPETLSFQLTVDVCNQVADRLKRPIYAHFSEIQLAHGRDPSTNDFKILTESHELLLTINRFCPDLLLNVVPLLEENLKAADEIPLRQLSVKTLGAMFSHRPGTEDPAKKYPSAWRAWIGRKLDKALPVRLAWVEGAKGILSNHPELRRELESHLVDRMEDADERVRAAICKVIGALDYETALHHLSILTLQAVGARMSDKKASVRAEAASGLAKLWNLAYSEIEAGDSEAVAQFSWIPQAMLLASTRRDATVELRTQILSVFKTSIVPLPRETDDEQAWVDRLLLVSSTLDDIAFRALERMSGLLGYSRGQSPFMAFIGACEQHNGGLVEENAQDVKRRLDFIIDAMARMFFGDVEKAKKDLQGFAAVNEPRLYKLYKTCVDMQSGLSAIIKARNELLRRLHQSHEDLLETMSTLVDVSAWNIINHSSVSPLIKHLQKPASDASASAGARLVSTIAKEGAPMFKTHVSELVIVLSDKKNEKLVEVALQALAAVCKVFPEVTPSEHRTNDRVITIGLEGTPRQAKFAARFLARSKESEACSKLINDILKAVKLRKVSEDRRLVYLRALAELALSAPKAFQDRSEDIIKYVMNEVMLVESPSSDVEGDEWADEDKLESLDRAKLIGLKVCTHWALGYARDPEADRLIKPTMDLLTSVLRHDGMVNEDTKEGGNARCQMRLKAALCLLKLANVKAFDRAITQPGQFELLAGCMQDPCFNVRHVLLKKLGEILPTQRLLPRWNLMPALSAMDPDYENVTLGRTVLIAVVRQAVNLSQEQRIERVELPLARLIHLLAHHPDFQWYTPDEGEDGEEGIANMQNLKDIARFIEMYLDCVANRDNIGLLYAIAGAVKGVRDRTSENNKPLYSLAELAQIIIRNKAEKHAWSVPVYPGKIKMPSDIFHRAENPEERTKVQRTAYLGEEVRNWARGLGKRNVATAPGPSRKAEANGSSPVRKRERVKREKKTQRKRRKVEESDDDSEDDEEDEDDSGEEEEEEDATESEAGEDENGEAVMGRGGRRGAKTKAKRAVAGKKLKKKKQPTTRSDPDEDEEEEEEGDVIEVDADADEESDLTDLD
ncbi:hypothetical protein CI109_106004 [Kwoniella shandongensis]|uniref:Uncharacterized protein n=1 Tax=Kwoniella shandongensis TaxID=1734106 RepID=A0A5M6C384_9TREE|nr:uncharacterized protein CI109_003948 [Kwoniella shandongensis]KAA5527689.1 hypothetical protein CI109_003948 [Kwoniella shandongensis]